MMPSNSQQDRKKRASVSAITIAQLCAVSAGCCQFKGCNHFLFETRIALSKIRQGNVAHIVGAVPGGPRGDDPMPVSERNKIENLMLMCVEHNTEIDSDTDNYPKEMLIEWKYEHEERIKLLRTIGPDQQRRVITFNGLIGEHRPEILPAELKAALLPFCTDGKDLRIDLSRSHDGIQPSQLDAAAQTITRELTQLDSQSIEEAATHPREVFAIGPIPLLVHLGSKLSSKVTTRIHNRHRSNGWRWDETAPTHSFIHRQPEAGNPAEGIALLVSVSAQIQMQQLPEDVSSTHRVYEIKPEYVAPAIELVQSNGTLQEFITTYRQVIAAIRDLCPAQPVKIFIAAPAAVAVACGHELLDRGDPALRIYDLDLDKQYQPTIEVNHHVK